MLPSRFFSLFPALLLLGPAVFAQELTPFFGKLLRHPERENASLELRVQLSEELASSPSLEFEISDFLGRSLLRFPVSAESRGASVRFSLELPVDSLNDGFYLLTARTPDRSVIRSTRLSPGSWSPTP